MVSYIIAYLAHTGFNKNQIRKAIVFEDSHGDYWVQLIFHIQLQNLPGAASSITHFYHGTPQAGLYGILTLLQQLLSLAVEDRTIPLATPIIKASPGNINKGNDSPYQGFFALCHEDAGDTPGNAAQRQTIISKFRTFGKNFLDVAVQGTVMGTKSKISTGGAWVAQQEVSTQRCLVGSLGGHKACFHQHHAVPSDICFKLQASPPPNWSKANPLFMA